MKRPLAKYGHRWKKNIKSMFFKRVWAEFIWFRQDQVAWPFKKASIIEGEFLDHLSDCWLLRKEIVFIKSTYEDSVSVRHNAQPVTIFITCIPPPSPGSKCRLLFSDLQLDMCNCPTVHSANK